MKAGLEASRNEGHRIVVVLGHPGFYRRFGFSAERARPLESPFDGGEAWMALELVGSQAICRVIRDFLSSLGLIDWEDETYRSGWYQPDGTYVNGKAAKWQFSEELMKQLTGGEVVKNGEVEEVAAPTVNGEGESILHGRQNIAPFAHWSLSLERTTEEEAIRPLEVLPVRLEWTDPGVVTQITGYFETLAA